MMYVSSPRSRIGLSVLPLLALSLPLGCAKVMSTPGGAGGGGGSTIVISGSGGGGGQGPRGSAGAGVIPDSGVSGDAACQQTTYSFVPKVPNVFVLVDGSGSMFDVATGLPEGRWGALRSALLPVIQGLQGQVNFGLGIFSA